MNKELLIKKIKNRLSNNSFTKLRAYIKKGYFKYFKEEDLEPLFSTSFFKAKGSDIYKESFSLLRELILEGFDFISKTLEDLISDLITSGDKEMIDFCIFYFHVIDADAQISFLNYISYTDFIHNGNKAFFIYAIYNLIKSGKLELKKNLYDSISNCFNSNDYDVIHRIVYGKILGVLEQDKVEALLEDFNYSKLWKGISPKMGLVYLNKLSKIGDKVAFKKYKKEVKKILQSGNLEDLATIINRGYVEFFENEELKLIKSESKFKNLLNTIDKIEMLIKKKVKFYWYDDPSHRLDRSADGPYFTFNKKNIVSLSLVNCELKDIPELLLEYKDLLGLHLEFNSITKLPKWIRKFIDLEFLDVGHNNLSSLPEEIGDLPNLQFLWLYDNNLTSLPSRLQYLPSLLEINLTGNPLWENLNKETSIILKSLEIRTVVIKSKNY
jgi:hypothetical protein